jgi:hypothetical protein
VEVAVEVEVKVDRKWKSRLALKPDRRLKWKSTWGSSRTGTGRGWGAVSRGGGGPEAELEVEEEVEVEVKADRKSN